MPFLEENVIGIHVLSISLPVSIFTIEPNTAVQNKLNINLWKISKQKENWITIV